MTTPAALDRLAAQIGDLIARQPAREATDYTQYVSDPVGFWRDVLKGAPWSKQRQLVEAVRDHPFTVVQSGNAMGKDHAAARVALWWVYATGGIVLLTGPTQRQVEEILMRREVARAFRAGRLPGELFAGALRRSPGGEYDILAMTSTEVGKLTGHHEARVLVVITEAQDVDDVAFEAAMANATGANDRILVLGNPLNPSGAFYTITRPASQWHKIQVSAFDHPNLTGAEPFISGGPTVAWAKRQQVEWGVQDRRWVSRILGEFPETAEDQLVTRAWLDRGADLWRRLTDPNVLPVHSDAAFMAARQALAHAGAPCVTLDVARFGEDQNVLAFRDGPLVREFVTWRGVDLMATVGRVIAELDRRDLKPPRRVRTDARPPFDAWTTTFNEVTLGGGFDLVVDEVGLGGGVVDRLKEQGYPVIPFHSGRVARDPERYMNVRAEAYFTVRRLLERGELAIPPHDGLAEELLAVRWRLSSAGKVQLESKDDTRATLGRSPDYADALAMSVWYGWRSGAPVRDAPCRFSS